MTIVSHRLRCIFIKTHKSAGTSLEIALSRHCGPRDIITPITPEDEELRRQTGGRGPQNLELPLLDHLRSADAFNALVHRRRRLRSFGKHAPASAIRARIGRKTWDSYFKFCFDRNPWDKAVSLYYYRNPVEPRPSIEEFVEGGYGGEWSGFDLYTIDGAVAVDRICRFENMKEELAFLGERLGLPEPLELPRAKGKFREDRRHYSEVLDDGLRERIARDFAREIALMGYTFD